MCGRCEGISSRAAGFQTLGSPWHIGFVKQARQLRKHRHKADCASTVIIVLLCYVLWPAIRLSDEHRGEAPDWASVSSASKQTSGLGVWLAQIVDTVGRKSRPVLAVPPPRGFFSAHGLCRTSFEPTLVGSSSLALPRLCPICGLNAPWGPSREETPPGCGVRVASACQKCNIWEEDNMLFRSADYLWSILQFHFKQTSLFLIAWARLGR